MVNVKRMMGSIAALIGVIAGLIAIFKIVRQVELVIGFLTLSFGILAVIWAGAAVNSLSKGSSLKKYALNYFYCVVLLVLYTSWNTMSVLFGWREQGYTFYIYPSYVFLTLAFLVFVSTSYQILSIGKEFGFKSQAKVIEKAMGEKRNNKKKGKK